MKYGYKKKLAFKSYGGEPTNWQEHRENGEQNLALHKEFV